MIPQAVSASNDRFVDALFVAPDDEIQADWGVGNGLENFDPDQPRDETGKWTDTGGGGSDDEEEEEE